MYSSYFFLLTIMNFGDLLHQHTYDAKKSVRTIESLSKKLINAKLAVTFNERCLNIYIYIKSYVCPSVTFYYGFLAVIMYLCRFCIQNLTVAMLHRLNVSS